MDTLENNNVGSSESSGTEKEVEQDVVITNVITETSVKDDPDHQETGEKMASAKKFAILLSVLVLGAASFLFIDWSPEHTPVKQFARVFAFVPEKISKSAAIQINLPAGVSEQVAQAGISFSPEIEGEWQLEELEGVVIFEPKVALRAGVYYAINMDTGSTQMSGDFYVDEDPEIQAIFPVEGSETHEDNEITIVFNRPMVPLTTLTEQEKMDLPITITPETPGRFKWISTRNLQFIPETTLIPSSEYTVEIGEGMYSVDGLPVSSVTHTFITRPLRYEHVSDRRVGYRSPMIISFNQPVDLSRTEKQITVTTEDGDRVNIEVEYGESTRYDYETRKYVTESDQSKLFIYQRKDKHGRSRLWDFETTYDIKIDGASPLMGTKDLTEGKTSRVEVPNIVRDVTAQSERTDLVRPDLLDPQGTLTVSFYEDVDKDKSKIDVKGVTDIKYGERCKTDENGNTVYLGRSCEKEENKSVLVFSFRPEAFSPDESFTLNLKQIKTPDGFEINTEPIDVHLRTYPELRLIHTVPANGSQSASIGDGMYMCTNVPLRPPEEGYVDEYLHAEGYVIYGKMERSWLIEGNWGKKCDIGEFQTWFQLGLLPNTDYSFAVSLVSAFEQTLEQTTNIKTGPAESKYVRFRNMQKQYNVTPPERTKLTYRVENLEYMDVHICRLEPETFLDRIENRADQTTPPQSTGCTEVVEDVVFLPPQYFVNHYFQVDLAKYFADTRGHYIVTLTNPLYKERYRYNGGSQQIYDRTYVSVTNLAVGKKEVLYEEDPYSSSDSPAHNKVLDKTAATAKNLYWVNNSQTLTPVVGASVSQYVEKGDNNIVRTTSGVTDYSGIARASVHSNLVGAVIRSGLDTAVVTNWADTLEHVYSVEDASRTYVYTDRPIYRPGHTVNIKGIDRIGFDGDYEVWNEEPVAMEIFDSRGDSVFETELPVNNYGTFSTEFEIPSDAPLGTYRISVLGQSTSFAVEEYVPAAFKIEAETNKDEYTSGDTMRVTVQADYYFGVPLDEGTVMYSVTAQDYYFDRYTDEYFNFGRSWYYCYSCEYGDDFLFRGEVPINEKGRAVFERELDFNQFFDNPTSEKSKLITVFITAKDVSGRSISMQKSFIVHKGDFYIGSKTDRSYTGVDSPITLRVKTVDTQGKPITLKQIEQKVYQVTWETFKRQEVDGGFYYRSEKRLDEISKDTIKTDSDGNWSGQLSFPEEGQYEIHITKEDDRSNTIRTISNVYIYGSRTINVPTNNNYELDFEVQSTELKVGDTGSLLIKSPYEKAKALITVERGTVYDYWVVDVEGSLYLHEFPIKANYAPNIFVSALLLSGDPEVKYNNIRFNIDSEEHELDVQVSANKGYYLPGEEVTLTVETKDYTGQPVSAEVSLSVADLSVLALKGNPKKSPATFFYDGFPLSVTTASNIRNILHEVDIPLGTKGGGGLNPEDLAKKKRGIFKDTAYWEASVETGPDGKATVSFMLPDNLTTWQIESLGVTVDTKLGVDYKEFTTKKDLMAIPLKPRFVVPGDTFSLGAQVFNQTDEGTNINVKLESDSLAFVGSAEENIFINNGESEIIYFEVVAPTTIQAGEHRFTFTATGNDFVDSVEQTISITPNDTYETVATANFTKADKAIEYLYVPDEVISGKGGLTINANATMAVFMTDALSYMVTYPYGCSEQLASSLSTIGILKNALSLPNVEGDFDTIEYQGVTYTVDEVIKNGLKSLYVNQVGSGGFVYYQGPYAQPSLSLTMHVVTALVNLRDAGYSIDEDVVRKALAFIESDTRRVYSEHPESSKEIVIMAEYVLRDANGGVDTSLTPIVHTLINDKAFLNEKISSVSLAYLAIMTATNFNRSERDQVYDVLKNRIDFDGRGAYLTTVDTANWAYFETPIKNTALLLKVFAAHEDEHPAMGNVLRWLLASRDKKGVWGGTHNTFVVVDAMVDYLKWQHETESHFTLRGLLDGVELFGYEFNPSTVFNTFTHEVAIDDLKRNILQPLVFERENLNDLNNNFYYDMSVKYFLPVESLPSRDEGVTITRGLYKLDDSREENELHEAAVGDVIKGKLTITVPDYYRHVAVEDIIPAGFEIVNFNLATEDKSLQNELQDSDGLGMSPTDNDDSWLARLGSMFGRSQTAQVYSSRYYLGGSYRTDSSRTLRPTHVESHDDRVFLYMESLSPGVYEYKYYLRALVPGEFQHLPARAEELFFPEVFGRTSGDIITIIPAK